MSEINKDDKPGYIISFTKQTSQLGEMIAINTSLPFGATSEDIGKELVKIGGALDERMRFLNAEVRKRTGKNLFDLGLDPAMAGIEAKEVFEQE
jgi:hypothetical protein